ARSKRFGSPSLLVTRVHDPVSGTRFASATSPSPLDPCGAGLRRGATVVAIRNDRIIDVRSSADAAAIPAGARTIDAAGKFLIPGLWDMHVHTFFGTWVPGGDEVTLPLFIANGVTGVRDMGSDLEPILAARAAIAQGKKLGPRLVIAGPMLDGPK